MDRRVVVEGHVAQRQPLATLENERPEGPAEKDLTVLDGQVGRTTHGGRHGKAPLVGLVGIAIIGLRRQNADNATEAQCCSGILLGEIQSLLQGGPAVGPAVSLAAEVLDGDGPHLRLQVRDKAEGRQRSEPFPRLRQGGVPRLPCGICSAGGA